MEQIAEIPQGAAKPTSGMDRLSQGEFTLPAATTTPPPATAPPAPVDTPAVTTTPATTPVSGTPPVDPVAVTDPLTDPLAIEPEFKDTPIAEEASFKSIIEALEYQVPEDYSEKKGFEILKKLQDQRIEASREEIKNFRLDDIISEYPETVQAEAKLVLDLLKTGQTLDQINAPIQQIKEWRDMPKEALIRLNLSGIEGYTQEHVDHKMEELIASGKVDIEHQILLNGINVMEKQLHAQRNQQIQQITDSQNLIREQKRQKELNDVKTALDRMPAFMDIKLKDENRAQILKDYQEGAFDRFTPADKAEFLAYKKYGKQAMQYIQSRATEKANLELAKSQHVIPPATSAGSRVGTKHNTGMERLLST